jgi:hypothetical protein
MTVLNSSSCINQTTHREKHREKAANGRMRAGRLSCAPTKYQTKGRKPKQGFDSRLTWIGWRIHRNGTAVLVAYGTGIAAQILVYWYLIPPVEVEPVAYHHAASRQ